MKSINEIELEISLLENEIDFNFIIDDYLHENYADDEIEVRRLMFNELNNRFEQIYKFHNLIQPTNGYSEILVDHGEAFEAQKNLHFFLCKKEKQGGTNASSDGSAELFEKISLNAVANFLEVSREDCLIIGEGRTNLTEQALDDIVDKLKERKGHYNNLPAKAKDDGVDFIVYKPIDTRNVGNLVILGQACVGKSYTSKKPIKERWLNEYIDFPIHPLTLLSIVNFKDKDELKKLHSEFHRAIIFDRGRILQYFDYNDMPLNEEIKNYIQSNLLDDA